MLASMLELTRIRASVVALAATVVLAGCGLPPLHRSVVVETNDNGIPVHASGRIAHDHYTVARGDTIYSIAFRANVNYHQLARWNGIDSPYLIQPGQVLRLTRPAGMSSQPAQAPVFQTVTTTPKTAPPAAAVASTAAHAAGHAAGTAASVPAAPVSTVVAAASTAATTSTTTSAATSASIPNGATRRVSGVTWSWPATGKVLNHFDAADAMPGINIGGNAGDPVRAAANGVVVYSGDGLVGFGELVVVRHSSDYLSIYGHNSKRLVNEGEHVKAGQVIARMGSTGAPRNELEFQVRYKGEPVDPLHYLPKR